MNAAQLLAHFDRLAEAPNAVSRLRRFILDLAVRGKLVEQDAGDEPAGELLKQISKAKSELIEAKLLKKIAASTALAANDLPFTLPEGWVLTRLGNAYDVRDGTHATPKYVEVGFPLVTSKNLSSGYLDLGHVRLISEVDHQDISLRSRVDRDDILFAMIGSIGNPVIVDTDRPFSIKNVALFKHYAAALSNPRFLLLFLQHAANDMRTGATGGLQPFVSLGMLRSSPIALPPLAEQHRIVAKVDELMALCDQLEAAQQERESRRDHLATASLQRLNQPAPDTTPEAQRKHASFHLHHLPRLTTRPEHIKAMRQTILNLAVCGNLSDSNEWSLYDQPLKVAATLQNGYAFKSEWFAKTGIRLLRNTNVSHGTIRWDELACLPTEQAKEFERFNLLEGDVVLSLDRPFIGTGTKVARVRTGDLPCLLLQRVGRFRLNPDLLTSDYLFLWIGSPQFTDQIDPGRSNGVPHISSKQVECAEIFLPPLAEQRRIVAKVDELMALCDQLEAQLTTTHTDSRRLLEAVLEQALAPVKVS